jgi:hypothetical protein
MSFQEKPTAAFILSLIGGIIGLVATLYLTLVYASHAMVFWLIISCSGFLDWFMFPHSNNWRYNDVCASGRLEEMGDYRFDFFNYRIRINLGFDRWCISNCLETFHASAPISASSIIRASSVYAISSTCNSNMPTMWARVKLRS